MNASYTALRQLFESKTAKIGVMGLGYVGLPLAVEMAKSGYTVYGIDIDERKSATLLEGRSYIQDVPDEHIRECLEEGRFHPTSQLSSIKWLDMISICVPTPLNEHQEPDTSYITRVVDAIKTYMQPPALIVLESTTYPGTTEELIQAELEAVGYRLGEDFFLCFSPERVDPSNIQYQTKNTPKVLGGTTPECTELGSLVYREFVDNIVEVTSPKVAEMSKLLENTFRSVNIAFMNEMALLCDKMNIDIWEVIRAASTKPFGFMPFYPGPGIGGHCIPLDPMYLSWKAKGFRFFSQFIELAQSVNQTMPDYVVGKTAEILNIYSRSIRNSRILLLGMAYKPEINDLRESPGLEIYELFRKSGALVDYYDPYAPSFLDKAGQQIHSIDYSTDKIRQYDCIVTITAHKALQYEEIANTGTVIFDTRNAFRDFSQPHIYKLGSGLASAEKVAPPQAVGL
ncbi:nucleotide sugar dehydrogenase [Paenibacillus hodogayensis]|uniref:Nucleotide sugar dehydrogenase n=1 Tax=Paenibacillus hodogayensis TaxID=279208 RepID=A0ABV5VZY0_9BACL